MPSIPVSQGPRVQEQALQGGYQNNVDVSSGLRAIGQGLGQVGEAGMQYARQQAETEAWKAQEEIYRNFRDWNTQETNISQGEKAAGYADRVDQWWKTTASEYRSTLTPGAQALVGRSLGALQRSTYDNAIQHQTQQLEIANTAAFQSNVSALGQAAIAAGPSAAAPIIQQGVEAIRARAVQKGVDAEPDVLKWTSSIHANTIGALVQRDPEAARQYFTANKSQIDAAQHDNVDRLINQASASNDGEKAAVGVWQALGPRDYASPVATDAMIAKVNEQFANDPERRKAGIAAVRERVAAHNQAQTEYTTNATNTVYGLMQQGATLAQIKGRPEWAALVQLNAKAADGIEYMVEQRALHRAQTADAVEGAELKRLQRQQHLLGIRNWDEYAKAQDPTVLAGMTRPQVQALAPVIGQDNTESLLRKKDKIDEDAKKPGVHIPEAKVDEDQFKVYVEKAMPGVIGKKKPNSEEKRILIEMRNAVEGAIDVEQRDAKRALSRDEKDKIIQRELSRTVTVQSRFWGADETKSVLTLTKEERERLVVPPAVQQRATGLMKRMFDNAKTPAEREIYTPTPANLRRFVAENPELIPTNGR